MPLSSSSKAKYSITQNIPVSDHVFKYLKARCGGTQLHAKRTNVFGSLALSLMGENKDVKECKTNYTKIFKVTISEDSYNRLGMYMCESNAQLFNDQVDKMFREELFFHVIINKGIAAEQYIKSIRNFLKVYDITEDDIKLDTVCRDFKRRKDQHNAKLNLKMHTGQFSQ